MKLELPENKVLHPYIQKWVTDSKPYASVMYEKMVQKHGAHGCPRSEKGYRLLYILNHLCPSLHHFCKAPDPRLAGDIIEFNKAMSAHLSENTQAEIKDDAGNVIQKGVSYTDEEFDEFMAILQPYLTSACDTTSE